MQRYLQIDKQVTNNCSKSFKKSISRTYHQENWLYGQTAGIQLQVTVSLASFPAILKECNIGNLGIWIISLSKAISSSNH